MKKKRAEIQAKMENMSDEEKQAFKEKMKANRGGQDGKGGKKKNNEDLKPEGIEPQRP